MGIICSSPGCSCAGKEEPDVADISHSDITKVNYVDDLNGPESRKLSNKEDQSLMKDAPGDNVDRGPRCTSLEDEAAIEKHTSALDVNGIDVFLQLEDKSHGSYAQATGMSASETLPADNSDSEQSVVSGVDAQSCASRSSQGSWESVDSRASEPAHHRKKKRKKARRLLITHTMGLEPSKALGLIIENTADTIHHHYRLDDNILGKGAFGEVKKAHLHATQAVRAAKIIKKDQLGSGAQRQMFKREIEIMKMVDHPNLLMLYEIFEDHDNMYLIIQLCSGGHLHGYRKKMESKRLSEPQAASVMAQVLRGISYLHKRQIIHRDMKAENVLLTFSGGRLEDNHLKVADFGLSRILEKGETLTSFAGTPSHAAPEVYNKKYHHACDIWSCGIILYELLCGYLPFKSSDKDELAQLIKGGKLKFVSAEWVDASQQTLDYINKLLTRSVKKRIKPLDALHHPWLMHKCPKRARETLHEAALECVKKFRTLSRLKRAVLHVMSSMIHDADIEKALNCFLMMDADCDGMISYQELKDWQNTRKSAKRDSTSDQVIEDLSYTEFIAATLDRKKHIKSDIFRAAFSSFDKNGDGMLSISELSTGKLLGHLSPGEVIDEIELVDQDGNAELDFNEFQAMFLSPPVNPS